MLNDDQVDRFRQNGFAASGTIGDASELEWIGALCNRAFARRFGCTPDALDTRPPGAQDSALMTIVSPESDEPQLGEAAMVADARNIAAQLFDVQARHVWLGWRLFVKPAGAHTTPWHQDAAYRPPPHCGATFWIPIDAPEGSKLSMRFIPGSHLGPLRAHDWHDGHLAVGDVHDKLACTNAVGIGEASIHHCLTLHSADPNRTDTARRAIALVCQIET